MAEMFPHLFNPESLGRSLREVATDVIKTSRRDVLNRWFHSAKDADLFIWMDLERYIFKQQLSFYGQVVEWNVIEGVKTGHVVVGEGVHLGKPSEVLRFDEKPQATAIAQAIAILSCVGGLKAEERDALVANFKRVGASQNMSAEQMIARFGEFLGQAPVKTSSPPSVWVRWASRIMRLFKA